MSQLTPLLPPATLSWSKYTQLSLGNPSHTASPGSLLSNPPTHTYPDGTFSRTSQHFMHKHEACIHPGFSTVGTNWKPPERPTFGDKLSKLWCNNTTVQGLQTGLQRGIT